MNIEVHRLHLRLRLLCPNSVDPDSLSRLGAPTDFDFVARIVYYLGGVINVGVREGVSIPERDKFGAFPPSALIPALYWRRSGIRDSTLDLGDG